MSRQRSWRSLLLATLLLPAGGEVRAEEPDFLMPAVPAFRTAALEKAPELVAKAALPEVPRSLPVFEIVPPEAGDALARRFAAAFKLQAAAAAPQRGRLVVRDQTKEPAQERSLTLFEASGGFFYMHNQRLYAPPEKQPNLPSETEAHRLALEFLRQRGLLPEDAMTDLKAVSFSRSVLTEFDAKQGKNLQQIVAGIEVRFPQAWDGFRVTGPGSKLYVALGDRGEVLGVTRMWRQAKRTEASLPSISPPEALDLLRNGHGPQSYPSECARAGVERMELAYWSESPRVAQRVALPVYRVRGTCTAADGRDLGEFEAYAPAVRNRPFEIRQRSTTEPGDDEPEER